MGSRSSSPPPKPRSLTLAHLESCFAKWIPSDLFPKASSKANSRDRFYTRQRTFWCMIFQRLNPSTSAREVVRQLQALFSLEGGPTLADNSAAYCRAQARLPVANFATALTSTAKAADRQSPNPAWLQGRRLIAVDGSALTLPDTPKNRAAYPQIQCRGTPHFPMMRFVVLFSMVSGAVMALAQASLRTSELALLQTLCSHLLRGDILVGDRGFGSYPAIGMLQRIVGVDFIGRTTRTLIPRRCFRRLGRNDWLFQWKKGKTPSSWLTPEHWAELPETLLVRVVKGSLYRKGFRVREATIVTTLLDPKAYPADEILKAYLHRWRLEMCLNDLKTSMGLDMLRGRTPDSVQKELYSGLIAHNLIRCTMASAASTGGVPLERVSFKGSVDAVRHFACAMAQARTKGKRSQLWETLLKTLAGDLVPDRPGRREPRAVKRKKNKYPRLNVDRAKFRDHPKRHKRRTMARLRKQMLK